MPLFQLISVSCVLIFVIICFFPCLCSSFCHICLYSEVFHDFSPLVFVIIVCVLAFLLCFFLMMLYVLVWLFVFWHLYVFCSDCHDWFYQECWSLVLVCLCSGFCHYHFWFGLCMFVFCYLYWVSAVNGRNISTYLNKSSWEKRKKYFLI